MVTQQESNKPPQQTERTPEQILRKAYDNGLVHFDLPKYEEFKTALQTDGKKAYAFLNNMRQHYDMPEFQKFKQLIGFQEVVTEKEDGVSVPRLDVDDYVTAWEKSRVNLPLNEPTGEFNKEQFTKDLYNPRRWTSSVDEMFKSPELKKLEETDQKYTLQQEKDIKIISESMRDENAIKAVGQSIDASMKEASELFTFLQDERDDLNARGKEIEDRLKNMTKEQQANKEWVDAYNKDIEKHKSDIEMHNTRRTEYDNLLDSVDSRKHAIGISAARLMQQNSETGNWFGAMWRSFKQGVGAQGAGAADLAIDAITLIAPNYGMSDADYKKLKDEGKTDEEILDIGRKQVKSQMLPEVRTAFDKYSVFFPDTEDYRIDQGTTDEYLTKWRTSFWGEAMSGLASSLPAMMGSKYQRIAQFALQAGDAVGQEMEGPDFEGITETEKYAVKLPIMIVNAVLEEWGFRRMVDPKAGNNVSKFILNRILKTSKDKIAPDMVRKLAQAQLTELMVKGVVRVGAAGTAEFETGALQEVGDIAVKSIYNQAKEKDLFQTPDSIMEGLSQVVRSGALEAVGGFMMSGVPTTAVNLHQTAQYIVKSGKYKKLEGAYKQAMQNLEEVRMFELEKEQQQFENLNEFFEILDPLLQDRDFMNLLDLNIKTQEFTGQISSAEATAQKEALDAIRQVVSKIPNNLDKEARREAFFLLQEKEHLVNEIAKADEALGVFNNQRLQEVNTRLQELSSKIKTEEEVKTEPQQQTETATEETQKKSEVKPTIEIGTEQFQTLKSETENNKTKKKQSEVISWAERANEAMSQFESPIKIIFAEDTESYIDALGKGATERVKNSEGAFLGDSFIVNLEKAAVETVPHELFHGMVMEAFGTNEQIRTATTKMLNAIMPQFEGTKIEGFLNTFLQNYKEGQRSEEQFVELMAQIVTSDTKLNKTSLEKIAEWINAVAKALGIKPLMKENLTNAEIKNILNTIAGRVTEGKAITKEDIGTLREATGVEKQSLEDGTNPVAEPTEIKVPKERQKIEFADSYPLSLVDSSKKIDLISLIQDINSKKQKVWFWVADQLGKGDYNGVQLDAGPSFAFEGPAVWASSKSPGEIERNIGKADYIFIISGSPQTSLLFNKKVYDAFIKNLGDFDTFKKEALATKPAKAIKDALNNFDSWDALRDSPQRKAFLIGLVDQQNKPNTGFHKLVKGKDGFVNPDDLRDGFYKANDFKLNDVMLVIKPTGVKEGSNHSTYANEVLGEVVGVPDSKVNAYEMMPKEIVDKYREELSETQKSQVVAPYGSGIRDVAKLRVTPEQMNSYESFANYTNQQIEASERGQSPEESQLKIKKVYKALLDRQVTIKTLAKIVENAGGSEFVSKLITKAGAGAAGLRLIEEFTEDTFKGLSPEGVKELSALLLARRVIAINNNIDALNKTKPKEEQRKEYTLVSKDGEVIDSKKAQDYLDVTKEKLGEGYEDLNKRADAYFEHMRELLGLLYESGRISEEQYNNLYKIDYMPIKIIKELISENQVSGMDSSLFGLSDSDIKSLTEKNEYEIFINAQYLLEVYTASVVQKTFTNNLLNEFDAMVKKNPALFRELVFSKGQEIAKGKFTEVVFYKDGKPTKLFINTVLAEELLDIKEPSVMEKLSKKSPKTATAIQWILGTKVLRFMATGGNLLFFYTNIAMDTFNTVFFDDTYTKDGWIFTPRVYVMGKVGYDLLKNIGTFKSKKFQETYRDFIMHGGDMDYLSMASTNNKRFLSQFKKRNKNWFVEALAAPGKVTEVSMRIAVYNQQMKNLSRDYKKATGLEPSGKALEDIKYKAAAKARGLIDFNQGGALVKSADAFIPYLNATFQGVRKPYDYFKENRKGLVSSVLQAAAGSYALQQLLFAFAYPRLADEDEDPAELLKNFRSQLSSYEKANYITIPTSRKEDGSFEYVRIRRLPLLNVITTAAEELAIQHITGSEEGDYASTQMALMQSIPITGNRIISGNPLVSSIAAMVFNKDVFRGEDVFKESPYKNEQLLNYAKGQGDKYVPNFIQDFTMIAYELTNDKKYLPTVDIPPKQLQRALESYVTTSSTNPLVGFGYALADASTEMFKQDPQYKEIFEGAYQTIFEKGMKRRAVRTSNPDLSVYNQREKDLENIQKKNTVDHVKKQTINKMVYADIEKTNRDIRNKKEIPTEIVEKIKELYPAPTQRLKSEITKEQNNQINRVFMLYMRRHMDRNLLNAVYERNYEYIAKRYGELDSDALYDLKLLFGRVAHPNWNDNKILRDYTLPRSFKVEYNMFVKGQK